MFRMEFHSLDAVEEDDEPMRMYRNEREQSVYEQYRHHPVDSGGSSPKVYEGRVGKFGVMQRLASSNEALHSVSQLPRVLTRSVSTNDSTPKNWVEVDLIDFGSPKAELLQAGELQSIVDQEVLRELVKPFADSVDLTPQSSLKRVENDVSVTYLDFQPASRDLLTDGAEAVEAVSPVYRSLPSLQVRSSSIRSTASTSLSDSDAESSALHGEKSHLKDEERGSPATRAYNRAFNKFMHKKSKPTVLDAKISKPWDEPLLASYEHAKLERKLQKETKAEAKKVAEEAKKDAENKQRELLELANPVPESALKSHKEHGVRKGIQKLFHIHTGTHSTVSSPREVVGHGDARESKLVMPRASMFETCMSPTTTDVSLAHIRQGTRQTRRKDMHFATVESNQRDVEAWTMEEYMAKNARLAEWERRKDDEEFGGIEGNQLQNQYFIDDATGIYGGGGGGGGGDYDSD